MSWASRRRASYLTGVVLFFIVVIGAPLLYWYFSIPATCHDGIQNQGETAIDEGGPCPLIDPNSLQPHAVLWARSFMVRPGDYDAVAYVENPNKNAGVRVAKYRFGLYDQNNVLVAERYGTTYLMPGSITPVFEGGINAGSRMVAHTYFQFTEPLVWEHLGNAAVALEISNTQVSNQSAEPEVTAQVKNTSVADILGTSFVAVVFDPAGNAFAASATALQRIGANTSEQLIFTWPSPFTIPVGKIDVMPLVPPLRVATGS